MLYIFIVGIIGTIAYMSMKSSYLYKEGMNSNKDIINSERLDILYNKEIVLKDAIDEYIRDKGVNPISIDELKTEGYIGTGYNKSNVFNIGDISFSIYDNKIEIIQRIEDNNIREKYINHYKKKMNKEIGDEYKSYEDILDNKIVKHRYMISGTALSHISKVVDMKSTIEVSLFRSCKAIKEYDNNLISGVYKIDPNGDGVVFDVYCEMDTDGGGWTLVWSNLEGNTVDLQESLSWDIATSTEPIFNGTINNDRYSFEVYTGLDIWNQILNNSKGEILYEWTSDSVNGIEKRMKADLSPFQDIDYTLSMSNIKVDVGYELADLYTLHNNHPFSTNDKENTSYGNCVAQNDKQPFWYKSTGGCWSGSPNGGNSNFPGSYFYGNDKKFSISDGTGTGAGSGFIFIR